MARSDEEAVEEIEKAVAEADALIRKKLNALGITAHHVILGVSSDGVGIIRSNVRPGGLQDLADMLADIDAQAVPRKPDEIEH